MAEKDLWHIERVSAAEYERIVPDKRVFFNEPRFTELNKDMEANTIGNVNLIQTDEEAIAEFLKDRNLEKVNRLSNQVKPRGGLYV